MFNDSLIVTTAVSAFNNAALYGPSFFITGLLCAPLFFMVYLYAGDFANRFGLDKDVNGHINFFVSLILALWLMLFGGNYAAIRDGVSLLPVLMGCVLFGLMMVVAQKLIQLKYIQKIKDRKSKWVMFFGLILIAAASGMHNWWGVLLQVSAVLVWCNSWMPYKNKFKVNTLECIVVFRNNCYGFDAT